MDGRFKGHDFLKGVFKKRDVASIGSIMNGGASLPKSPPKKSEAPRILTFSSTRFQITSERAPSSLESTHDRLPDLNGTPWCEWQRRCPMCSCSLGRKGLEKGLSFEKFLPPHQKFRGSEKKNHWEVFCRFLRDRAGIWQN